VARLTESQGKRVLAAAGIDVPRGEVALSPAAARVAADRLGGAVVVKGLAWTTGRAGQGLIAFAADGAQAEACAATILGRTVRGFPITEVLVEERLEIAGERFASIFLDDSRRRPVLLVSSRGGTGIEEVAREHPGAVAELALDPVEPPGTAELAELWRGTGVAAGEAAALAAATARLWQVARGVEARAAEVNPLVVTRDGRVVALDCRLTVDDAAVFRHKELGIDVARDLGHPPTPLERIAWEVERDDYRGTFYFMQMREGFGRGERVVAFHGAGGGGSMMAMDALQRRGFAVANFCDTSGNPPASKVYRAARVLLSQPGVDGYFGSGSGVASQEQFHAARGLVKAFCEEPLGVPAVVRLGGNGEDRAIEILTGYTRHLGVPVECYGKDTPVDDCAARLEALVAEPSLPVPTPRSPVPVPARPYTFSTPTGSITYDHAVCATCASKVCVAACVPQILTLDEAGLPVLNITLEEAAKGRCIECLACEVDCRALGGGGGHITLPVPGLEEYRRGRGME
jgi:succinyl-CoA synthetase beta subunit